MLDLDTVRKLLAPFEVELSGAQTALLLSYLELLERWNRKINLTAIRRPEEIVTRHFGESLYLGRLMPLEGQLLDIGSGAGFPGLALKLQFPGLAVTLLEPVGKKRAFLKEVVRTCGMTQVEVRSERLEEFARRAPAPRYSTATARAVGQLDELVPAAASCLKPGGRLALWISREQAGDLQRITAEVTWTDPFPVPLGHRREIWVGTKLGAIPGR